MTEQEAIEFARSIAIKEGWSWLPPVRATKEGSRHSVVWQIVSNAESMGVNVRIIFNEETREIISKHFCPR